MTKKLTAWMCILLVGMLFLSFTACASEPKPDEKPSKTPSVGDSVTISAGTLTFVSETESSATFSLKKATNASMEFYMTGDSVVRAQTDESGKNQYENEGFFASTNANTTIGNHLVNKSDKLIALVNGDKAALPTQPGTYEITFDYKALVENGSYPDSLFHFSPFGAFTRQEPVMMFDELRFTLLSVYTDAAKNSDVADIKIHVNQWISAPDKYIQKLYIRSTSGALVGVTAFGEPCETETVNGQAHFVVDATKPNSQYNMDIWLKCFYEKGALMDAELALPKPTALVDLSVYLNNAQTQDACHAIKTLATENTKSERFEIYATTEAAAGAIKLIMPTVFPTTAKLVNQIIVYPESGGFYAEYKTENKMENYTVCARDSETVYGDQKKETFAYGGVTYTKITREAGYEYPPYNIDFCDAESKDSKMYYTVCVNARTPSDWHKIVQGLRVVGS